MLTEKAHKGSEAKIKDLETRLISERSMRQLVNKIHSSSLDEILIQLREEIGKFVNCDRVTIYAKDMNKQEIFSKFKDGGEVKEIRLAVSTDSLAGFVAHACKTIRIDDAYNAEELKKIDPGLKFDITWDKKTGYRTKQILAVPVMNEQRLHGVIQVVNTKHDKPFSEEEEETLKDLSQALAIAFHNQAKLSIRTSRYDYLFRNEIINSALLDKAHAQAQGQKMSVDYVLVNSFKVPKEELAKSLSEFFKCEFVPFNDSVPIPTDILHKFKIDYLKHNVAVPLALDGGEIIVAMENPKNVLALDSLQRVSGKRIRPRVSTREEIFQFIDYFYGKKNVAPRTAENIADIVKDLEKEEGITPQQTGEQVEDTGPEVKEDDSGIVRLVNQIIEQSYEKGASDIHVEPYIDGDTLVRIRIDGVCHEYARVPKHFAKALVARIKIMSDLNIAEKRLPQDGKIKFRNFSSLDIELRVATIPTTGGQEDVVMRILASSKPIPIDNIGMIPENLSRFKKVVNEPYGMVLCVGPTGSGKTTTLHAALGYLNQPDTKIWTAEDPVEITQKGLRQVQVHAKIGLSFERCLRSFLRCDPDIIMIGEMRDTETAEAAIEASLTGHLVFSTLHTNSAPETVTRLLDIGVDPFAFGDSLLGVLAQRLVRKICSKCKEEYVATEQEWNILREEYGTEGFDALCFKREEMKIARGKGCETCNNTGYKGRVGIHEFLVIDDDIRQLIYKKAQSHLIRDLGLKRGLILLKQDGIRKVLMRYTDFKEVRSACMK